MQINYDDKLNLVEVINEETIDMPKELRFELKTFKYLIRHGDNLLDTLEQLAWEDWFADDRDISFEAFCEERYGIIL